MPFYPLALKLEIKIADTDEEALAFLLRVINI